MPISSVDLKDMPSNNNNTNASSHQQPQQEQEHQNLLANTSTTDDETHNNNNNNANSENRDQTIDNLAAHLRISATIAPSGVDLCGIHIPMKVGMVLGSSFIFFGGLALGFGLNTPISEKKPGEVLSSIIGWIYFLAWTVSFFPQIYINYRRKSVIGQSFDYLFLNLLGFAAYTVFNVCFYFSDAIKKEYETRFDSKNEVQINDVGFAVFALILTIYNVWQVFVYERGDQVLTKGVYYAIMISIVFCSIWSILLVCGVRTKFFFNPLDLLYGLSILKVAISVYKYIPQIYLNYTRKTTAGWNIYNVLLDFTGGSLSFVQEMLDAGMSDAWVSLVGNLAKIMLGLASVFYDIIMMVQHYCLYAENNAKLAALYKAEVGEDVENTETQQDSTNERSQV